MVEHLSCMLLNLVIFALVDLLISRAADIRARDGSDGKTSLVWASECGHVAVIDLLISKGADTYPC